MGPLKGVQHAYPSERYQDGVNLIDDAIGNKGLVNHVDEAAATPHTRFEARQHQRE